MLSAQAPALCVDSQRRPLVMAFQIFRAMRKSSAAWNSLVQTLKVTEKLLDGFPIPGAKGTIGAFLHIIDQVEVCTGVNLCYFVSLSPSQKSATNDQLCRELRKRIEELQDQVLRPLASKGKEQIPPDTLIAFNRFMQCVALFPLGTGFDR